MLEHLTWAGFLRRWSDEVLAYPEAFRFRPTEGMRAAGWIGAPPAAPAAVAAAEKRLWVLLPPSYTDFLAVTNGWPVLDGERDAVLPVERLGRLADLDPQLLEVWEQTAPELPDTDLLRRSLCLSSGHGPLLLDPGEIRADGEWAAAAWTSEGGATWPGRPSFRGLMEEQYALFVCFGGLPETATRADVERRVEEAYRAALAGDREAATRIFDQAAGFGDRRGRPRRSRRPPGTPAPCSARAALTRRSTRSWRACRAGARSRPCTSRRSACSGTASSAR